MSVVESTVVEASPFVVARAAVRSVELLSPSFARITFGGADLDEFGDPERILDQRIKLIFPPSSGRLPDLDHPDGDWWAAFLAVPEEERGSMRTYSIRELRVEEGGTAVVIDFVLHLEPGFTGPASAWASQTSVGDELLIIGPRRGRPNGGGIEYAEFIHCGKGRDMGFIAVNGFETKISAGNSLQCCSRDLYRLSKSFDLARLFSMFFSGSGFYGTHEDASRIWRLTRAQPHSSPRSSSPQATTSSSRRRG